MSITTFATGIVSLVRCVSCQKRKETIIEYPGIKTKGINKKHFNLSENFLLYISFTLSDNGRNVYNF